MSHGSVHFLVPGANPLSYILKLRKQLRELHNFAYRKSCAVLSMRDTLVLRTVEGQAIIAHSNLNQTR